jgi:hypothetical protein
LDIIYYIGVFETIVEINEDFEHYGGSGFGGINGEEGEGEDEEEGRRHKECQQEYEQEQEQDHEHEHELIKGVEQEVGLMTTDELIDPEAFELFLD